MGICVVLELTVDHAIIQPQEQEVINVNSIKHDSKNRYESQIWFKNFTLIVIMPSVNEALRVDPVVSGKSDKSMHMILPGGKWLAGAAKVWSQEAQIMSLKGKNFTVTQKPYPSLLSYL